MVIKPFKTNKMKMVALAFVFILVINIIMGFVSYKSGSLASSLLFNVIAVFSTVYLIFYLNIHNYTYIVLDDESITVRNRLFMKPQKLRFDMIIEVDKRKNHILITDKYRDITRIETEWLNYESLRSLEEILSRQVAITKE